MAKMLVKENGEIEQISEAPQIYSLIGQAMKKVGAIGKDSVNEQQKYKFRGIDAVYNALNPVMSELGLFICPEILDHRREERVSESTYNNQTKKTVLKYSILTIKYTVYAPDGSNVSCVVVGEGMDSGDKASNKAMSVAMKYAMFQLLMIPTEEMVDPDMETHEVTSGAIMPEAPKQVEQTNVRQDAPAQVTQAQALPGANPVTVYLGNEKKNLQKARQISPEENAELWVKQLAILRQNGLVPAKALSAYTMQEAERLISLMYTRFMPTGTELKPDDRETA